MSRGLHYDTTREFFDVAGRDKQGFFDDKDGLAFRSQEAIRRATMGMLGGESVESILDVGCGRGDFTLRLAAAFPEALIMGIDFSPAMLGIAGANRERFRNMHLAAADLRYLPLENPFDVVVCLNTLHHIHIRDRDQAIAGLAGLARRTVILEIKNRNLSWILLQSIGRVSPKSWQHKSITVFPSTIGEMQSKWQKHGFKLKDAFVLWKVEAISPLSLLRFDRT